jgi:hypothetical protein
VNLPPLPEDTIYLSDAPDGIAGQPYDGDISFRMPKTTTPVAATDPGTPAGLTIDKITIISVVNMPPGLTWEANETEFEPADQTDGCVKFCGTPLQPGLYNVEVFVTAEVLLIAQSTSFSFPIYIAPAVSSNAGFAMQNSSGCGAVTVGFQNNVPGNGQPGITYAWDFGNGTTSTLENPADVTYSQPGVYPVSFTATIDTFGYQLTTIQVLETGCGDIAIPPIFNGNPDLYLIIKDNNGNTILQTDPVDNSPVPFAFTVNLPVLQGNYSLEVRDDDTFGSEGCGTVNFSQTTTGTLASGELLVALNIIHPVSTIQTTDSVTVYPFPAPPALSPGGLQQLCEGEDLEIAASYDHNLQWFQDTSILFGETAQTLLINEAGNFWVEYTSPDGCKSQSAPVEVSIVPLPQPPAFHNENNLLVLNDPAQLPAGYSLQWLLNGTLLPGETGTTLCMTNSGTQLYALQVTDNATGCQNQFSIGATFNPAFDCTVATLEETLETTLTLSPNPAGEALAIRFDTPWVANFDISVSDARGRQVFSKKGVAAASAFFETISLQNWAPGVYVLQIRHKNGVVSRRFVRQ